MYQAFRVPATLGTLAGPPQARNVQRSSSIQEGVLLYNVSRQIFTGHKHPVMCDNEGLCATYWEAKVRGAKVQGLLGPQSKSKSSSHNLVSHDLESKMGPGRWLSL